MLTKKSLVVGEIITGTRLLVRVGNLFKHEILEVTVKEVSPKGDCVKLGNGIEWFAIKSLKIVDILKV